jgi:phage baseplate assembly protein W
MAVPLGQQLVIDSKQFSDYAIGISLPIRITTTAFNQTFYTIDQVRTNIKNLLLTKRGERLMQPQFGSGLQEFLFEPITDEIAGKIEAEVLSTLSLWLPYVTVNSIEVDTTSDREQNTINLNLVFSVANGTQNTNTATITFQQ